MIRLALDLGEDEPEFDVFRAFHERLTRAEEIDGCSLQHAQVEEAADGGVYIEARPFPETEFLWAAAMTSIAEHANYMSRP